MKIKDILKEKKITVSFEMFPPKVWDKLDSTKQTVRQMCDFNPSFMSVTYGAAGTTSGFTTEIANEIKKCGVTPLSHLTCLTSTKEKITSVINELKENAIENVLALRGDIPEGFVFPDKQYYEHAYQLVNQLKSDGDFCVGGACYPEIHPDSKSKEEDLVHLKEKVDCGLDFLTTQMFFDNELYLRFRDDCAKKGIEVPIIAGIMPVTNANQITRILTLSECKMPKKFEKIVERFQDSPQSMKQAGIVYASEQIIDLMANGVNNIHIYTMNKPDIAGTIMKNLSEIIDE